MTHLISIKALATVAVTLGAFAAASSAHARADVTFSVGVQVPGIYVQSAPVYVQPRPIYVQPRPIYVPAPSHHGGPHWQGRGPYGDRDHDGIANVYDRGGPRFQGHPSRLYGPYGDLDRDGVINKWDRFPTHPNHR